MAAGAFLVATIVFSMFVSWYYEKNRTLTKPSDWLEYLLSVGGRDWHPARKMEDAQAFRPAPIPSHVTDKATKRRLS
jgi:hypothetical protein